MKIKKKELWICAILLAMVPVIGTAIYILIQGNPLPDIFIPDSGWNDELFYYKLVESVLEYGCPRGYFGFNESHAQYFSFASWSPVILVQWIIWGAIFGWNLLSPVISNLVTVSLALYIFAFLAKPSAKETSFLAILLLLFKPLPRYILSCVPETEIFSAMILFIGLCINLAKNEICRKRRLKIVALFLICIFLSLVRPYFILLFAMPCFLWTFNRSSKKNRGIAKALLPVAITGITAFLTIFAYLWIGKRLCAPYLEELYYTDWIKGFLSGDISGGFSFLIHRVKKSLGEMLVLLKGFFVGNAYYAAGLYYFVYGVVMLFLTVHLLTALLSSKVRKRIVDKSFFGVEIILFIDAFAFGAADILMYRIEPGGRHTLVFVLAFLLILPWVVRNFEPSLVRKKAFAFMELPICLLFIFSFWIRGDIPYEYQCSFDEGKRKSEIEILSANLEEAMVLEDNLCYDNTVIWTLGSEYSEYYAVPTGFGISCCFDDFVINNYDGLESKYVGVAPGSKVEECVELHNGIYLAGNDRISFYQIR